MLVRILFGLGAWCLISVAVGLLLGPVLRRRGDEQGWPVWGQKDPEENPPEE